MSNYNDFDEKQHNSDVMQKFCELKINICNCACKMLVGPSCLPSFGCTLLSVSSYVNATADWA